MMGESLLRTILIDHFKTENPGMLKGELNRLCQMYSSNDFVRDNYRRLDDECDVRDELSSSHILLPHLYRLGPQLPWITGNDDLDPTMFEAWVADRFEYRGECYLLTKYDVLPALGLSIQAHLNPIYEHTVSNSVQEGAETKKERVKTPNGANDATQRETRDRAAGGESQ